MQQMEQERLVEQDMIYQLDNDIIEEQRKKFNLEMELEKYVRQKGKQPKRASVQRQTQVQKPQRDEYEDTRKSTPVITRKIVVPLDDDDFVDLGKED